MEARKNMEKLINQFEENLVGIKTDMLMEAAGLQASKHKFYIVEKDLMPKLQEIEDVFRNLKVKEQMDIDELLDKKMEIQSNLAQLKNQHQKLNEDCVQMKNELAHLDELKEQISLLEKKQGQLINDNQQMQKDIEAHQSFKEKMINQTNEEITQMRIRAKMQADEYLQKADEEKQLIIEETKNQVAMLNQKAHQENQRIRENLALEFRNSIKNETTELVTILSRWFFSRYYSNQSNQETIVTQIKREFEEMILSVLDKRKSIIDEKINSELGLVKKIVKKLWPL